MCTEILCTYVHISATTTRTHIRAFTCGRIYRQTTERACSMCPTVVPPHVRMWVRLGNCQMINKCSAHFKFMMVLTKAAAIRQVLPDSQCIKLPENRCCTSGCQKLIALRLYGKYWQQYVYTNTLVVVYFFSFDFFLFSIWIFSGLVQIKHCSGSIRNRKCLTTKK